MSHGRNGEAYTRLLPGLIEVHIFHHAAEEPIYGLAMIEELQRHCYVLSPGTLYPVLHSLQAAGYLTREDRNVDGKVRKYCSITEAGTAALTEARALIRELVDEVLEESPSSQPA